MTAAALLAVGACAPPIGGPSPTSTTTTVFTGPTTTTTPARDAADAFRTCLAERDVSIDEIPLDGNGRPRLHLVTEDLDFADPEVAQAITDCSVTLAAGALDFVIDDLIRNVVIDQLESFSECMRARGLATFPDPIDGFTGVGSPYPVAAIPYDEPRLAEVVAWCRDSVMGELP